MLQNHLNTCAYNVTKDQEAVTVEIKNVSGMIMNAIKSIYWRLFDLLYVAQLCDRLVDAEFCGEAEEICQVL